jgi:hypothetical protein
MPESFPEFIKSERARLNAERKTIAGQQRDLEKMLADIDRELAAISAYETTKSGKAAQASKPATARRTSTKRRASGGARRTSRREGIIAVLKGSPAGLSRGEILAEMGLKGNKAAEMSVSNALTGLTKGKQVARQDGKYVVAAG